MSEVVSRTPDFQRWVAVRRDLHAHPELAFAEHRTAKIVAEHLREMGLEVHCGLGQTGVVGVIRGRHPGLRAIGLRADMDALPLEEQNTFAYRSRHAGCMHACGHDGHTAMLLAASEALAADPDFAGTVYVLFQPAEEGEGGARAMIEDGLFQRFPMEAVFGLHNWPGLPAGEMAVHAGAVMAGTDRFDIEVRGQGTHAAMPHLGKDPVVAAAALVQALQTIVSRTLDPLESAVLLTTVIKAGEAYNIIPESVHLAGTVRTFSERVRTRVRSRMEEVCAGIGALHDVTVSLRYSEGYPPTINTKAEAALCAEVAAGLVGADKCALDLPPSMGAEDFAFFLQQRPGCYVWLGNGPTEGGCTLHNPNYDFNDAVLPLGARYWVNLVRRALGQPSAQSVNTE